MASLLQGSKPLRAQAIIDSVPKVDRVSVRVIVDSYQFADADGKRPKKRDCRKEGASRPRIGRDQNSKGARSGERPFRTSQQCRLYIFFEHFLFASSHMPSALSQLALSVAFVTSPAKAGPVKASAKANAKVETSVFMDIYSLPSVGRRENSDRPPMFLLKTKNPARDGAELGNISFRRLEL